jgi:hypothetical protein
LVEKSDVKNAAIIKTPPILLIACVALPLSLLIIGLLIGIIYLIRLNGKKAKDLTDK